jgi:multicomponent Na+:H+ antiporter subunit F
MSWAIYTLYLFMAASLYRLVRGPTVYDRLLAFNLVSAQLILLMCFHAIRHDRSYYLDVAMIYTLLSFAETIAFVRFYRPNPRRESA